MTTEKNEANVYALSIKLETKIRKILKSSWTDKPKNWKGKIREREKEKPV